MKTDKYTFIMRLILLYLICYFMQIFAFPNILMLLFGGALCLTLIAWQKKIRVDAGIILLAVTMFSYCMIVFGKRAVITMMPYIPLVIYVLANYLGVEFAKKKKETGLLWVVGCLIVGYTVHGILNSYMYFAGYGWEGTRYWMDIWTMEMTPGTQLTIHYLPIFAVVFPAIIYFFKRKWMNSFIILGTLYFIYVSIATRTRTTLLILILVLGGQMLLYVVLERRWLIESMTLKKAGIFALCVFVVVIVLTLLLKDVKIVQDFIQNLGKGGGIIHNVRFQAQALALQQLFDYPMGGFQMQLGWRLAHNLWLDIANAAGLIPFFAFVAYTIWSIYELIRFLMQKEISTEIRLIFAGIYGAFFLYYMVEPALMASVHLLCPWIFLHGLIHGYLIKHCTEM